MGSCCETMLCKKIKAISKANNMTPDELKFMNKRSLYFKDPKMRDGF